ncbi:hypothetical protein ACFE04_020132 [Oxalis oulophora]
MSSRWNLTYDSSKSSTDSDSSSCEMEFEFLEDGEMLHNQSYPSTISDNDDDHEDISNTTEKEDEGFWNDQHQQLQSILCRSSSVESNIRNFTKQALKEIQSLGNNNVCRCGKVMSTCKYCLMTEISLRLSNGGYDSAICKAKWRCSSYIPSGEHTYLDVKDNSKKGDVRIIIELNFRAEFEMARANEEYNRLVRRLPEVFVGKVERLSNVIKIVCSAAKKCMKEKKMHLGPWRKQKYMQAKWLGTNYERTTTSTTVFSSMGYSIRSSKPKASMLTVDLLEKLPNMHCTAVKVL